MIKIQEWLNPFNRIYDIVEVSKDEILELEDNSADEIKELNKYGLE